ncbi:hypothetical protein HFO45_14960 [Rhizobium leguminosarum]|uniref:HNH endonuclease n=1 Tax=Rhizobium leguminosarum TaxID=384 RepID=UPI001C957A87|nr:hypothetical protein [Rhizobium leguminosarum]MBY5649559.1 hypothetical protein [Rhizobium leguminosarum]
MDNGKLLPQLISAELAALFQSATDAAATWSSITVNEAKRQLKVLLFQAQNGKCAYCRRLISDEPGHVEIDHILPKGPHGNAALWSSNDVSCRKATSGYPQFTFVVHNLALTCKRCNNKKGTYDSRRDRSIAANANYTLSEEYYDWLHIYAHNYFDHIQILDGLIYQVAGGSSSGEAVISVCKLDEIAAVEKASAELKAKNATSLSIAIGLLLTQVAHAGWDFVVDAVSSQFPNIPIDLIEAEAEKYKQIFK